MELDEEQQAVVDLNESMVCIAGPGSGKTRWVNTPDEKGARQFVERVPGVVATYASPMDVG